MKKGLLFTFFIAALCFGQAEQKYDPSIDAMSDIKSAISLAKKSNKHIFVKVGGNWCGWCKLYAKFAEANEEIMKVMNDNYVEVLVNWSMENKNPKAMAYLGYPQRFGFPVFVVLDNNGEILHTQNSAFLEEGKGYNLDKVLQFINGWTPKALDPITYQN